ncbi:hypothetical protein TcCL_ESM02184 [Trypanosoma cruzi]|nr:hypothetical protein TcCL_ESM02184 [Trypanosoma cruzi]
MHSKRSPVPKNSMARPTGVTGSALTAPSLGRETRNASTAGNTSFLPSRPSHTEAQPREDQEDFFSPSDLIIPFHLDIASRLMGLQHSSPLERNGEPLQKSDVLELQMALDDYAEGLVYSTRQLFMHDNRNMVQQLQQGKDVSTVLLFLQMQREMRQLNGDDSAAKERELIQRLSDHLEA